MKKKMINEPWEAIFGDCRIHEHDFDKSPFIVTADQIKVITKGRGFEKTGEWEPRILCKHDTRESRPEIFVEHGLFLLPILNGTYAIIRGEGYVDIPPATGDVCIYNPKLDFPLKTLHVGDSEMQHLDFAYTTSLVRTFIQDKSLILTIRGRKRSPQFSFRVGSHNIAVNGVQIEVDAGYEGKGQVVVVEAKNNITTNVIIRQLFYPFHMWRHHAQKTVRTLFFEKREKLYSLWEFVFDDTADYNSIRLERSQCFEIVWQ